MKELGFTPEGLPQKVIEAEVIEERTEKDLSSVNPRLKKIKTLFRSGVLAAAGLFAARNEVVQTAAAHMIAGGNLSTLEDSMYRKYYGELPRENRFEIKEVGQFSVQFDMETERAEKLLKVISEPDLMYYKNHLGLQPISPKEGVDIEKYNSGLRFRAMELALRAGVDVTPESEFVINTHKGLPTYIALDGFQIPIKLEMLDFKEALVYFDTKITATMPDGSKTVLQEAPIKDMLESIRTSENLLASEEL